MLTITGADFNRTIRMSLNPRSLTQQTLKALITTLSLAVVHAVGLAAAVFDGFKWLIFNSIPNNMIACRACNSTELIVQLVQVNDVAFDSLITSSTA